MRLPHESEAYLDGYFLGDGVASVTKSKVYWCTVLYGNKDDQERVGKEKDLAKWGTDFRVNSPGVWALTVPGRVQKEMIGRGFKFPANSRNKEVPEVYFTAPEKIRVRLLEGLWDSDGCISIRTKPYWNPLISYGTVCKDLAEGVQEIVKGLGMVSSLRVQENPKVWTGGRYYSVNIMKGSWGVLAHLVTLQAKKQALLIRAVGG